MGQPVIRSATAEDASFIAWAIMAANRSHLQRGWFDITLDRPEPECLEFLRHLTMTRTVSWWHHSLFLVAEVDNRPASALCRFRAGDGYSPSETAMAEAVRDCEWEDAELRRMLDRGSYIFGCIIPGDDDCWTIENVATLPQYRGQGLTGTLLERALEDGRSRGFKEASITFLIGNDPAERAYTKAGFTFQAEKRHPDFEAACGSPGLRQFRVR